MVIITSSANLHTLRAAKLLSWSLHDLERRLRDANIATLTLGRAADAGVLCHPALIGPAGPAAAAAISMELLRQIAQDGSDAWVRTLATATPEPRLSTRTVDLPAAAGYAPPIGDMLGELLRLCMEIRVALFANAAGFPREDTYVGTPDRAQIPYRLRAKFGGGVLPPALARRGPEIAFALPHFAFGGVEKVTMFAARALRKRGYGVSLLLLKSGSLSVPPEFHDAFDRVFFLDSPEFESWTGPRYLGTALSRWSVSGAHADELNLASAFDAVIACHAADFLGLMGDLRRRGVITASYNHLFDITATGGACGHPYLTLAFEHALDLFICCSRDIALALHSHGVPAGKLVTVPNAAGLTIPPAAAAASLRAHLARTAGPLHVLFVGRLDHQKGLDRLAVICQHLRRQDFAKVRIIGRQVLSDGAGIPGLADLCEAPLAGAALLEAYQWADIVILPSLYEGLPLTLVEAMQMGTVPIAAAAGAIAELITNGENGFIVSQAHCVTETLALITQLHQDRPRLHGIMRAAAELDRNWDDAVAALDAALSRRIVAGSKEELFFVNKKPQKNLENLGQRP